jgi:hypothetical protein
VFRHNKSIGTSDHEQMPYDRRTDSYLLNNEIGPECIPCNCNYSFKHVLIDSVDNVSMLLMFGKHSTRSVLYIV